MQFMLVKQCLFHSFFEGDQSILVSSDTKDSDIVAYLNKKYYGGNWDQTSLRTKIIKVRDRLTVVDVTK